MSDVLVRSMVSDFAVVGDGRTVVGLAVPYGEVITVNDSFGEYRETFDPGAFARVTRARPNYLKLQIMHDGPWIGRGDRWLDSPAGLGIAFRLDDTEGGRTAAFKVRDQQLAGLSIAFIPGKTMTKMHPDGMPVEHRVTVKSLEHVALVDRPAYADAAVSAIRSKSVEADRLAVWQAWLDSHR